ncbi:MAG: hypothetical protein P1U67_06535 [Alcanivoracaceae bacterium]|nr:hypothetical protein [Alcanivoracaceae bacterium]
MGELKDLRTQQEQLLGRAKELGNKLYLAGLGAVTKAEASSTEMLEKYSATGSKALGEKAEGKPKAVLVSRGALEAAKELIDAAPEKRKELYETFIAAGSKQRGEKADGTNEFVLAGLGAVLTARSEGEKFLNDLIATGEKRA